MNESGHFTFYGDLLGVAAAYRLSPDVAYEKLNSFYNTVFSLFEDFCVQPDRLFQVYMFSDSVLIWGKAVVPEILERLQQVYLNLVEKNLLLRGALVHGALEKEPRLEVANFRKFLPTNDTLARAVGLANTVKGARLLIEPPVAHTLLTAHPQWLTLEGYTQHLCPSVPRDSMLRRICPSPSGESYELLYFWRVSGLAQAANNDVLAEQLKEMAEFQDTRVAEHLRETAKLFKRSNMRRRMTERGLSGNINGI